MATAAGIPVSHLDSHHHVHTQPHIFWVVKRVQWRYGIRRIRTSMNLYLPTVRPSPAKMLAKQIYHAALVLDRSATTQICADFRTFYTHLLAGSVPKVTSIELMTHPGARTAFYVEETNALKSDWEACLKHQVPSAHLVSYRDL